jgi:starch synthase
MRKMNFALYYAGDAYSTDRKIMGRQSAGKALMRGVARWDQTEIHGFGASLQSGQAMDKQLRGDGYKHHMRWHNAPGSSQLEALGAVYYPAPVTKPLAHARNQRGGTAYSLFGVTHTLSSAGAMDQLGDLILPPFQPWDALICTSTAALSVVSRIHDEMRAWFSEHTGATRFNPIALPVIPLGVDVPAFAREDGDITAARRALGLEEDEVAFLFAGRLSFHAKSNPAAFYLALEAAAARCDKRLVCVEAGVFPNPAIKQAYDEARSLMAPSARVIRVDGANEASYRSAWQACDVFVSLSDNIQETFGLTPLEAMAAGMPVLVSDWNGYKDTVRDGIDGYRIPVTLPPAGTGADLAERYVLEQDSYDYYIGRVSMATSIDLTMLTDRMVQMASDAGLRNRLGQAGQARARSEFDWPIILDRYVDLADDLSELRRAAGDIVPERRPGRPDPFALFADYPTQTVSGSWRVSADPGRSADLKAFMDLGVARYAIDKDLLPAEMLQALYLRASSGAHTVESLLTGLEGKSASRMRAMMWLAKLGLVTLTP